MLPPLTLLLLLLLLFVVVVVAVVVVVVVFVVVVVVVVVVLTLTRIIKSVLTGQAPVTLVTHRGMTLTSLIRATYFCVRL